MLPTSATIVSQRSLSISVRYFSSSVILSFFATCLSHCSHVDFARHGLGNKGSTVFLYEFDFTTGLHDRSCDLCTQFFDSFNNGLLFLGRRKRRMNRLEADPIEAVSGPKKFLRKAEKLPLFKLILEKQIIVTHRGSVFSP